MAVITAHSSPSGNDRQEEIPGAASGVMTGIALQNADEGRGDRPLGAAQICGRFSTTAD